MLYLNQKNWDKREKVECPRGYEWEFISIGKRSYENKEHEVVPWCEIILRDDKDWEVRLQTSWTNPSRSIVNSLAGRTKEIGKIKVSVRAKDVWGKMYAQAYLSIDGERTSWLLQPEEQNKLITLIKDPETGEVVKRKYTKFEEFLESKYDEINKKSRYDTIPTPDPIVEKIVHQEPMLQETDMGTDDDLPF